MESNGAGWFYISAGKQTGPVSWDDLLGLAVSGRLLPTDPVWSQGMVSWQPAHTISGLEFPCAVYGQMPLPYEPPLPRRNTDESLKWIMPVGRSAWAIAAGYLGLFAFVAIGAPFAVITGIIALIDIKNHPGLGGRGRAIFGIITGTFFTLIYGYIIILSVIG